MSRSDETFPWRKLNLNDWPIVSLEESIEPVRKSVSGIGRAVEKAKRNCFRNSGILSVDESAAIFLFSMRDVKPNVSSIVNLILHEKKSDGLKKWFLFIKLLTVALEKVTVHVGPVWRIVKNFDKKTDLEKFQIFSCVKSIEFLKNTRSLVDKSFSLLLIDSFTGRDISKFAEKPQENEIVFLLGTKFLFVDLSSSNEKFDVLHFRESIQQKTQRNSLLRSFSSIDLKPKEKQISKRRASVSSTENSLKSTRLLFCPQCSTKLKFDSTTSRVLKVSCCVCAAIFHEIICPQCEQSNCFLDGNYRSGFETECSHCQQIFRHFNCPHCRTANFRFGPEKYFPGTSIECSSCQQNFSAVHCPNCSTLAFFKNKSFISGLRYRCSACSQIFQPINCPHCSKLVMNINERSLSGRKVYCPFCQSLFQFINCPKCSKPKFWKRADRTPGYSETCSQCQTIFQHINCPFCDASHLWLNGDYRQRQIIPCLQCQRSYQHSYCSTCHTANYNTECSLKYSHRIKCATCETEY